MEAKYVKLIKALQIAEAKAVELEDCILEAARFAISGIGALDGFPKTASRLADEMQEAALLGCRLGVQRKKLESYDYDKYRP